MKPPSYVLITPVRNEERTIGSTINSVLQQTIPPGEWVIVSDGSTDRTDEIVNAHASRNAFISLLQLQNRPARNFASVVFAIEAGVAALKARQYEFLGLLDADVTFSATYYEEIMRRFSSDPKLGLAGGLVSDYHQGRRHRNGQSLREVAGAVQFFRRECFEALGGLVALPEGGWDAITCVQARMQGFRTRTFEDIQVDHLKPRNAAEGNVARRFRQFGVREYAIGNHPLFELVKCGAQCVKYPIFLGGLMQLAGYMGCCLIRKERTLAPDILRFRREEQLRRLFPF